MSAAPPKMLPPTRVNKKSVASELISALTRPKVKDIKKEIKQENIDEFAKMSFA